MKTCDIQRTVSEADHNTGASARYNSQSFAVVGHLVDRLVGLGRKDLIVYYRPSQNTFATVMDKDELYLLPLVAMERL